MSTTKPLTLMIEHVNIIKFLIKIVWITFLQQMNQLHSQRNIPRIETINYHTLS